MGNLKRMMIGMLTMAMLVTAMPLQFVSAAELETEDVLTEGDTADMEAEEETDTEIPNGSVSDSSDMDIVDENDADLMNSDIDVDAVESTDDGNPDEIESVSEEETITLYSTSYSYTPSYTSLSFDSAGGVSAASILSAAESVIISNEGGYTTVTANDNGALSIGKMQWHGSRALALMRTIVAMDTTTAYSTLGSSLYSEITASSTSWSSRTLTSDEATRIAGLLGTSNGQAAQDKLADSDVAVYLNNGYSVGLRNAPALVYYADVENQSGASVSKKCAGYASNLTGSYSSITLNELHIATICYAYSKPTTYLSSETNMYTYISRRRVTYGYAASLGWTYCSSGDFTIPYDTNGTSGTKWLQTALNTYQNAGLVVDGDYGTLTKAAVVTFQASVGLDQDGLAGLKTSSMLIYKMYYSKTVGGTTASVTIYDGVDYSAVYDYTYYINKYSDLKSAFGSDETAALAHFVTYGMKEGRQAISTFNVTSYRYAYPDLRLAYGTDLRSYYLHYINYGLSEGRTATGTTSLQNPVTTYDGVNYSAVYDFDYYISKYSDIKKAYGDDDVAVLKHFITYGMKEGRQAISTFDVTSYRYKYQDLRLAYGTDLKSYYLHYINYGKKEGRVATGTTSLQNPVTTYDGVDYSAVYDYTFYVSKYSDIKKAYGDDDVAVLKHFITYGMKEGRQASSAFNVSIYRSNYEDLRNTYGSNLKSYYLHYIKYGKSEGRNAITLL